MMDEGIEQKQTKRTGDGWYVEAVRRLHAIVPLALLVPLFSMIPVSGMDDMAAAAADGRLPALYLSSLLLVIPAALMYLAEARLSRFISFLFSGVLCIVLGTAGAVLWCRLAGLTMEEIELPADLVILLLFFFDAMSMRYNDNSRIRSKREADLSWTGDRSFLPAPHRLWYASFAAVYVLSLYLHSTGLGNCALAGAILYFFLFYPYRLLKGRSDYLESRRSVSGVPETRIRRLSSRNLAAVLPAAGILAAASLLTAGGRHFLHLPVFTSAGEEAVIEGGIRMQESLIEELLRGMGAGEGADPPLWLSRVLTVIENLVTLLCIAVFLWGIVRLVRYAARRFRGIEREEKALRSAEDTDEHIRLGIASSGRLHGSGAGIRRRYRKLILRRRRRAPAIHETPSEMEALAQVPETEEYRSLHALYEEARYGRREQYREGEYG